MKIVLFGSNEYLARSIKDFLISKKYEVFLVHKKPKGEGEYPIEELEKGLLNGVDMVINLPEKYLLNHKKGQEYYKKEFTQTRIEPTKYIKEAILKAEDPPDLFISFSSVGYYPKDEERFYTETESLGEDPTSKLIKAWEEAAFLGENSKVRTVILRTGIILSREIGILTEIMPLFKFNLGTIIGQGSEAFPWIYLKDLYWLILFFLENKNEKGVYNTVAPQVINSRSFSQALSSAMHKPIWLKLPRKYFQKKLGDVGEIVYAKSKIYPARLLQAGFSFRYPAIYPAIVDTLSSEK